MSLTKNELEKQLEQMIQKRSIRDPNASTHTIIGHARAADKPKPDVISERDKIQHNFLLIPSVN